MDLSGGQLLSTVSSLIITSGSNQVNPTTVPDCFELSFVLYFLFGPMVGFYKEKKKVEGSSKLDFIHLCRSVMRLFPV